MDRPLAESLHEWLLGSPHRTADPAEADYFFLPVSVRQLRTERTAEVLQYVVRAFPFFNRSRGADHLLVVTDDSGLADTLPFMGEARRREVELNDTESLWHGLIQARRRPKRTGAEPPGSCAPPICASRLVVSRRPAGHVLGGHDPAGQLPAGQGHRHAPRTELLNGAANLAFAPLHPPRLQRS